MHFSTGFDNTGWCFFISTAGRSIPSQSTYSTTVLHPLLALQGAIYAMVYRIIHILRFSLGPMPVSHNSLDQIRAHSKITQRSLEDHSRSLRAHSRYHSKINQRSLRDHSEITQISLRDHWQNSQKHSDRFEDIFGSKQIIDGLKRQVVHSRGGADPD